MEEKTTDETWNKSQVKTNRSAYKAKLRKGHTIAKDSYYKLSDEILKNWDDLQNNGSCRKPTKQERMNWYHKHKNKKPTKQYLKRITKIRNNVRKQR